MPRTSLLRPTGGWNPLGERLAACGCYLEVLPWSGTGGLLSWAAGAGWRHCGFNLDTFINVLYTVDEGLQVKASRVEVSCNLIVVASATRTISICPCYQFTHSLSHSAHSLPTTPTHCPHHTHSLPPPHPLTAPTTPTHCPHHTHSLPPPHPLTAPTTPTHCPHHTHSLPPPHPLTAPTTPTHCPHHTHSLPPPHPLTAPTTSTHCPHHIHSLPPPHPLTAPTISTHCPHHIHSLPPPHPLTAPTTPTHCLLIEPVLL